jgi:hypothetical protein
MSGIYAVVCDDSRCWCLRRQRRAPVSVRWQVGPATLCLAHTQLGRLKPVAPALNSRLDRTVTSHKPAATRPRTTGESVVRGSWISLVSRWFGLACSSLGSRFENPVLEPGVEESRALTGAEGALFEFDAPVPCGGIGNDLTGIPAGGQRRPDEVGK